MDKNFGVSRQHEGLAPNKKAIGLCRSWNDAITQQAGITVKSLSLLVSPARSPGVKAIAMVGVQFERISTDMDPESLRQTLLTLAGIADRISEQGGVVHHGGNIFYVGPISADFNPA